MRGHWRTALGVALSVAFLYLTLRQIDVDQLMSALRGTNVPLLVLSSATATVIFWLRAIRWRVILDPVAPRLPLGILWRSTAIGMMVNNLYPARPGEIVRAYALTRETDRVGFSAAFASLAIDRMFDALTLIVLLLVGMIGLQAPDDALVTGHRLQSYVIVSGALVAALVLVLYSLVFFPGRIIGVYEAFARRVAPRFEDRGRDLLHSFSMGLGVLRSPGRFAAVFLWTLLHWLVNALAFWIGFLAVGIHVPFGAALLTQGLIAIGVSIPSSPGFVGVFEYLGKVSLSLYGLPSERATAWALAYHLFSFIPITVIGLYYASRLKLTMREARSATSAASGTPDAPDTSTSPGARGSTPNT
jgi:hypothetical protein